jgi:hypothetical protein
VILFFSPDDFVYAMYDRIPAAYDPSTNTASFGGPLIVVGGEGNWPMRVNESRASRPSDFRTWHGNLAFLPVTKKTLSATG